MRRLTLLLVVTAACRTAAPSGGALTGAATPTAAVEAFLGAARAQDLQALGAVWGDEAGLTRDRIARAQLEQLQLIHIACLRHDRSSVANPTPTVNSRYDLLADLTQGSLNASVKFTVARGPSNRWYVQDFDIVTLQNRGFCRRP